MSASFQFAPPYPTSAHDALRTEVRAFLTSQHARLTPCVQAHSWTGFDRDFSLAVGARGWIGMNWPEAYGGRARPAAERYVVMEEMLAAGAPLGAHWTGERQTGPLLLRVGTEEQKRAYLPRLARGEISVCIGLSEPDAGSDLAAVRSRAERIENGWRINGRKVWTTNAHCSEYMLALLRTGEPGGRHAGLSQFMVDLRLPGVEVRPIQDTGGGEHFNEVTFEDVRVPSEALVGVEGEGWRQVTAELAFERSGPDRYLSSFPLFALANARLRQSQVDRFALRCIGEAAADLFTAREMSLSIADMLADGRLPDIEAALFKEFGSISEQALPEAVRSLGLIRSGDESDLAVLLDELTMLAPTFSLRGGTREIMQGLIARGVRS